MGSERKAGGGAGRKGLPPRRLPQGRFLVFFVLSFCIAMAAMMGAFREHYWFEQADAEVASGGLETPAYAFADGSGLLLPLASGDGETSAAFAGSGKAEWVRVRIPSSDKVGLRSLSINGIPACGPCEEGRKYYLAVAAEGRLLVEAQSGVAERKKGNGGADIAFIDSLAETSTVPHAAVEIGGGWGAEPDRRIPSSVYGTDAPFHLNRVRVLPSYLSSLEWPHAHYSFISVAVPAAARMFFGLTAEYAYKLWQFFLFFLPVGVFYLLSRRLPAGSDASFAFASLLYLSFPVTGLPNGGGPDVFMYGMTAHTLASSLALLFFLFAWEYSTGGGRMRLALSALFFMLAFASNPRISVALGFLAMMAVLPAVLGAKYRRVALLGACCAASIMWSAVPFALSFQLQGYGALGGASATGEFEWAAALLQSGYIVLPLLAIAGAAWAYRARSTLAVLLGGAALSTLLFTTSPAVNGAFHFVDGIRFLPSFFLPAFFLAGMGAYAFWRAFASACAEAADARGWDRVTLAGAVALGALLPLAVVFSAVAISAAEFHSHSVDSLETASDYLSLEEAYGQAGGERVVFVSGSFSSQYPVFEKELSRTYIVGFSEPEKLAELMRGLRLRYLILGAQKSVPETEGNAIGRGEEYAALSRSSLFEEVPLAGATKLFILKGGEEGREFFAAGADALDYSVRQDRARFSGVCRQEECSVVFFSGVPAGNDCRLGGGECFAEVDAERRMVAVGGIPRGEFGLEVSPKLPDYWLLLVAASAAVAAGAVAAAKG